MKKNLLAAILGLTGFMGGAAHAADGTWTLNNSGDWSLGTNWSGGIVADGAGSIADFSQLNITTSRTVTVDGAVASRTVGTLLIGDTTAAPGFSNYTIAASNGGTLTFNNNASAAVLTQVINTGANTISAPVQLAGSLNLNNTSANTLSLTTGGITASTAGTKTITNLGSGTGGVSLSGVIGNGSGSVAIVQDSATSALSLLGANTFNTGVLVKQGTLIAGGTGPVSGALGTGTLLLGDTTGSANATFAMNTSSSVSYSNPITVQAGTTGKLTITHSGNSASARPNGDILLNNDLTLEVSGTNRGGSNAGSFLATGGVISGTGDLSLEVNGGLYTTNNTGSPQGESLNVLGNVTTSGAITNVGTGEGRAAISGSINNASSLSQNSATSMLSLSGTNTYTGPTNVNAGILRLASLTALPSGSTTTVADGATLLIGTNSATAITASQPLTISGHGTSYSNGAIESSNNGHYSGAVILGADSSVSNTLTSTILTLSGGITGSGNTLTVAGVGNHTLSGGIATGSGGLIKVGTGIATLSASNSYTGATQVNAGVLALTHTDALGGGGDLTFGGGILRLSSTNEADLGNRIANSVASIAIDTNARNVTYSEIGGSNTGGLLKTGSGSLTLSGTNSFTGPIVVNNGALAVSASSALPATGTGLVHIESAGALNSGGAYANVQEWLDSDNIATASTGAIALTGNSSENIDFTGYSNLSLGASSNSTYSGTITPAGTTYRLGGGSATLTINGTNAVTGANALVVNGAVTLGGANNLSGATTVESNTLTLNGANGSLASSAISVNPGATLAVTTSTDGSDVTRAASVTLNRGTLNVVGNNTANSSDTITGALTIGAGGTSTVTLNANAAKNTLLNVGSYNRAAGGIVILRGQDLGVSAVSSGAAGDANLVFATPNLVGAGGTGTNRSIFVGALGGTTVSGTGFGATGGLLTQDATNGVRLLSGADYKTSITDGQTALDNVQLTSTGATATTTLATATTINSLSLNSTTAAGANVQVTGAGTLTLNSGVIYANSVTATTASAISNTLDFNGREGIILAGGSANLTLSGVLSNTGGNGLTVHAAAGRSVTLSGTADNTYTGTTTVNGGTLALNKTAGINAIPGNLTINAGGIVSYSAANQLADSANITVQGGTLSSINDTINNLTLTSGSATTGSSLNVGGNLTLSGNSSLSAPAQATLNVTGTTNLSDGGSITLSRSQNINGVYDSVATLSGALNITNTASGAYTPITIGHGSGLGQSGAKLVLGGDVTFTGNSTNTNTVLIDAIKGAGRQGIIELTPTAGNRTFNVGNGAAKTDLTITAAMVDGAGASGLIKTGGGTLALTGVNTYTGPTTISGGTMLMNGSLASAVTVNGGKLGGSGTFSGTLTIANGGTLAPGNSPGIQTAAGGLTLETDSAFEFELIANTTAGRGANFDGVDVTGGTLTIETGVDSSLVFNASGSTVDFTSAFWDIDQDWLVFDNANSPSLVGGIFGSILASNDSLGNSFSVTGGALTFTTLGNDIYLSYTVVPEPSSYTMLGLGIGALWLFRRRKTVQM